MSDGRHGALRRGNQIMMPLVNASRTRVQVSLSWWCVVTDELGASAREVDVVVSCVLVRIQVRTQSVFRTRTCHSYLMSRCPERGSRRVEVDS